MTKDSRMKQKTVVLISQNLQEHLFFIINKFNKLREPSGIYLKLTI